jgi:hypothetical protein
MRKHKVNKIQIQYTWLIIGNLNCKLLAGFWYSKEFIERFHFYIAKDIVYGILIDLLAVILTSVIKMKAYCLSITLFHIKKILLCSVENKLIYALDI